MTIPTKKSKSGFEIPVYGLGTWQMGGRDVRDLNNNDEADILAIRTAIDLGVSHIDTAEAYANGYTETLIGKAIDGIDRSKLFLASKVHSEHLSFDDVVRAAHQSLERLGVDYLDLYIPHSYNSKTPIKETINALDSLKNEGLIKNIGVSNFNVKEIEEAQSYSQNKIVSNQVHYNLIYREADRKGVLAYCQENDIILTAWRPLQKGILSENNNDILNELAKKYDKTSSQIAINWLISQKNVVTIAKTTSAVHLQENLGALNWEMSKEDIERLTDEYPGQKDISDAVPLH